MGTQNIHSFDLPSVVDVDAMDEMHEWLKGALETGDIIIEGAKVSRLVTNALLMLVSAKQTADKNNLSFHINNPSAAFVEAVTRLGMGNIFSPLLEGN